MTTSRTTASRNRRRTRALLSAAVAALLVAVVAGCGSRLERAEILAGGTSGGGGSGSNDEGTLGSRDIDSGEIESGDIGGSEVGGGTKAGGDPGAKATQGSGSAAGATGPASNSAGGAQRPAVAPGAPRPGGGGGAKAATGADARIFGGTACSRATGTPIQLGNVSTLSGVLGQLFSPVVPALQVFVKSQNDCGGLNGHPMKLVVADDQGDPSTARTVANRQIKDDKILAFLGNIQVLTIDAMVSVVNANKVPIIGGDVTNNTWFVNQLIFPQAAPPQAVGYGYNIGAKETFGKVKVGGVYCIEVPGSCNTIQRSLVDMASKVGTQIVSEQRVSLTAPSYQSACLAFQRDGAEVIALTIDAAAQVRFARDCAKVNYRPNYVSYPLAVGNENQFLGNKELANTYVPLNTFGWMAKSTPAEKYYQASVKKYNPGFTTGNAASLGWVSGALIVAASGQLTDKPTSQQFLDGLYTIKNNNLGGITAPLTFVKGKNPRVPYCLFELRSNKDNSGWETPTSKARCTDLRSDSDPNK